MGLGMFGEQGAESIHALFNQPNRTYANMKNGVQRLESVMAEHFRQVCPDNVIRQQQSKQTQFRQLGNKHSTCYYILAEYYPIKDWALLILTVKVGSLANSGPIF